MWDSLDESGDISTFTATSGANILDTDNPACGFPSAGPAQGDGVFKSDLSGYLTIDVVNYCTNYFPDQTSFYDEDAIATAGWGPTYTPNALIGDVFYVDSAPTGGNISGDPAVPVEFDNRRLTPTSTTRTFFGKFVDSFIGAGGCVGEATTALGCTSFIAGYAPAFQFGGDGREPLGDHYGFRFLADGANGLQSWVIAWRSDWYQGTQVNLCTWLAATTKTNLGLYDTVHQLTVSVFDNDENFFQPTIPGGPSGNQNAPPPNLYLFLESQRVNLLAASDYTAARSRAAGSTWLCADPATRAQRPRPASSTWAGSAFSTPPPARSSASATRRPA